MMNKEQFIAYMNKKLAIIKERERKDIIDEYINHIDMKVQEGMSEEEAIAAFGDIDEMVKEILDAYNIDPSHTRSGDGFDRKVNEVLDAIFDSFQKLLSNVTSMDVDNIVRLLFEVLVVLVLLAFLHIPFEIFASIGASLLRSLFGYGIGSTFAWIWNFVIKLVYVITFIAVLVNVANRRWSHFRDRSGTPIMDDVKESFNFEQAKEAVHRFTNGTYHTSHKQETPYKEDTEEMVEDIEEEIEDIEQDAQEEYYEYHKPRYNNRTHTSSTGSILGTLIKIFGFLLMLPFILLMIGLCCALGFLIILSTQDVTIIGFYFVVIGSIIGCGAVIGLIERFCKGGRW